MTARAKPRVLFLPWDERHNASARCRIFEVAEWLAANGWDVSVRPPVGGRVGKFLGAPGAGRMIRRVVYRALQAGARLAVMQHASSFRIVVLQRELFPFGPAWLEQSLLSRTARVGSRPASGGSRSASLESSSALLGPSSASFESSSEAHGPAHSRRRSIVVYDLDDALHVRPPHHHAASHGWHDFSKAERIARQARAVVVSSAVLEEWARPLARAVIRIPTAVDTQRFRPLGRIDSEGTSARNYSDEKPVGDESKGTTARARHPNERSSGRAVPVVGWTGTAGNFAHLASIRPALAAAAREVPFVLRVVGERAFEPWDEPRTEFIPWSLEDEAEQVARFDIGLMPLIDSEYARAKAGYKALVYMACGVPPVVSPVGTNREILDDGMEGFFAETLEEWKDRLVLLLRDAQLRARLGAAARARVVAEHSQQVLFPRWASLLEELGRET